MVTSEAFREAAVLLSGRGKWRQGEFGFGTLPVGTDEWERYDEHCYCALGALGKVQDIDPDSVSSYFGDLGISASDIVEFNDAKGTTRNDVVLALLFLAEALKSEGL